MRMKKKVIVKKKSLSHQLNEYGTEDDYQGKPLEFGATSAALQPEEEQEEDWLDDDSQ